jgi:PAS domain S-box-containing protein
MQILTKRFGILTGFAFMMALLMANALVIRKQLASQLSNQAWVAHTRQVQFELLKTESVLQDAEIGQRGYLYTNDLKYLTPYEAATREVAGHLDSLQSLTGDNPHQQARIVILRQLTGKKLDELGRTVALARAERAEAAKGLVLSDTGLLLMDDIRNVVGQMQSEENRLEAERSSNYRKSIATTILCVYLASAVAALGLALLLYYILREMEIRRRHAAQLLEREEWFRVTMTSLGDAVIATDDHGIVNYLNPLAEQLIGQELTQAKGKPIEDVFPIFNEQTLLPVENPVAKVMELGRIVGLANHTVLRSTNGSYTPIEDSAAPIRDHQDNLIGVVLVFRDATLERKTQAALRESEKLTSAARMSATVAHEINNPLEAVGNLLYLVKGTPGLPEVALEHLIVAEQELERVSHIAKQTLAFYRESKTTERIDIVELVEYVLKLQSNKFKTKTITVQREFGECPPVTGSSGELKQAVSNLISNAADAVGDGGTICIRLSCVENIDSVAVHIEIEDDGPGVAAEHVDRLFEPFFTTKADVGNGLGLWVTKEIIERHRGTIVVNSRTESGLGGAAFVVEIPCEPVGSSVGVL